MDREPITLMVDPQAAQAFRSFSPAAQNEFAELIALRLRVASPGPRRSLDEIMDEVGKQAQEHGMTPDILQSILEEED